ncbi:hypothetical protein BC826DRAFT_460008 [Russula brevipes]|nr:hypothetical protein BC826DRAFT_460008 [Russula brevipes]
MEPRYPTSRPSSILPSTDAPALKATVLSPNEQASRKPSDHRSGMGLTRSSNQASHDVEQPSSTSASPHQGPALAPQSNGRVNGTTHVRRLPRVPSNTQVLHDKPDRRASRTLARDPLLHSAGTPPEDGLLRNVSQMLVTRTTPAPLDVTPPQTPDKHMTPPRRASPRMRERSLNLASPDPESEPAPEPVRRGPLIFTTQNVESRPSTHERESPREVGQRRHRLAHFHSHRNISRSMLEHLRQSIPMRTKPRLQLIRLCAG